MERASGGEVRVRPVMVTEDPERDTPAVLARYCASYSPRLLGLSGSEQQVIECKKLYYVDSGVARALGDPDGDLLLDRTSYFSRHTHNFTLFTISKALIYSN